MKTKEINGKHYIDAKIVMLQSNKPSYLQIIQKDILTRKKGTLEIHDSPWDKIDEYFSPQHIYILSCEKPNKGQFVYDYAHDKIGIFDDLVVNGGNFSDHAKKIIATTDYSLNESIEIEGRKVREAFSKLLFEIPKDFIEQFVGSYNNGNKITDVLVEVENVNNGWQSLANSGKVGSTVVPEKFELKIYNGNFINIKFNQKDWNELAKIGSPEKWMEVYTHYQELLLENDTREFLENIPKKSWDDIYNDINTIEFQSKIEVFNYLKKHYYAPIKINQNC
jgi:hypothetical protein